MRKRNRRGYPARKRYTPRARIRRRARRTFAKQRQQPRTYQSIGWRM